jgi:hypothetical protein
MGMLVGCSDLDGTGREVPDGFVVLAVGGQR